MKKRVLIIVENLPVPFDTRVWKEASSLQKGGYEVSVLCPRGKDYTQGHEVIDGIHIYRHPMPKEGNSPLGYLYEYGCALFWEFFYTWWIYLRRGFHVIQGCNPPDDISLIALPYKLLGIKYIFDHHDANPELYLSKYEKKGLFYWAQVWLEKLTYRFSDVVMATNESYKNLAITRGGRLPEDVFVVRNGPDLENFEPVAPIPALKHGKDYLVGYVGTMSIQEGMDILLDVALYIKNQGRRDIHFTCVGGGPGLEDLRQMALDKNLQDMVSLTGRVPDQQLLEILSTADVCVNPDKPCQMNDISTMIKIMEYMALKKPIVQFDLKEGRFSAQEASLYSDNNNQVPDFAEKILWLLDRPKERKRMGELGRKRVETELAWDYSVKNLLAAYQRVFSKSARRNAKSAQFVNEQRDAAQFLNDAGKQKRQRRRVTMNRLVSILIPAYNAGEWIGDTLRSALEQTWDRKEIIVVDDGSTDRTLEIARQFESDSVHVFTQKNQGAAATRNRAFSLSKGDYIQWLDADDLLSRGKIARQMEVFEWCQNKRILVSSAWGQFLYRHHRAAFRPTPLWCDLNPVEWLLRKMGQNLHMQTATWLVSRELTEAAGPWNTQLLGDDDGEYFCRVLLQSDGVRFVPEARVYYRASGASSLSYIGRSDKKREAQWRSMELHIDYLRSLEDSPRVRAACVKYIHNWLFSFYPERPDIVEQAKRKARELGGHLDLPCLSWKYSWIEAIFGLGLAKRAQMFLPRVKWSLMSFWDKALFRVHKRAQAAIWGR